MSIKFVSPSIKGKYLMARKILLKAVKNQNGIAVVIVAICLVMFVGFMALAVDVGHLMVARNELQNAADAGALAGAGNLYLNDGTAINPNANQIGWDTAVANTSEVNDAGKPVPVEVNWTSGNTGDVQRGHWSFGLGALPRGFYPNASTNTVDLWGVTTEELDADPNFINAVRVRTRRQSFPITSFFARIFGDQSFQGSTEAVAYIGFAGKLNLTEADQPIAICKQSIVNEQGKYDGCNIGRMLNSGSNNATHNTAGWTNFSQPCHTSNANEMKTLICDEGNFGSIEYGRGIGSVGGVQNVIFNLLRDCWISSDSIPNPADGLPDDPWGLTLPVIDCPGNNVSNCAEMVGAVTVQIIFMSPEGGTPSWDDAPRKMNGYGNFLNWPTSAVLNAIPDFDDNGEARWQSFVDHFELKNVDGLYADYAKKSMYFLPSCETQEASGVTGGENFGVLAKIPVLVD